MSTTRELIELYSPYYHWARGIQFADRAVRLDERRTTIHETLRAESHGSPHFWRGVIDGGGNIGMTRQKFGRTSKRVLEAWPMPTFMLTGSPRFLAAFVEWLYAAAPHVDHTALLAKQCKIGKLYTSNQSAADIVTFLWPEPPGAGARGESSDEVLTIESHLRVAQEIRGWIPRGGARNGIGSRASRGERVKDLVSLPLVRYREPVVQRVEYGMLLQEVFNVA